MNTTSFTDGRVESRVFYSREEAEADARAMLADPTVRAVETTKLADMPDDYPCPCRSGMKYGRCCRNKAANSI